MKPTLEQAQEILDANAHEKCRIETCIAARICPECGADLISEPREIFNPPIQRRFLFWKWVRTSKIWDYRIVCSAAGALHYEYKYNITGYSAE